MHKTTPKLVSMGAVIWTKSLCLHIKCSYPLSHPSNPLCLLFMFLPLLLFCWSCNIYASVIYGPYFSEALLIFLHDSFSLFFILYVLLQSSFLSKKCHLENYVLKGFFISSDFLGWKFIVSCHLKFPSKQKSITCLQVSYLHWGESFPYFCNLRLFDILLFTHLTPFHDHVCCSII